MSSTFDKTTLRLLAHSSIGRARPVEKLAGMLQTSSFQRPI
jgi:hypothetical protein